MAKKHRKHGKDFQPVDMPVGQLLALEKQLLREKNYRRLIEVAKALVRKNEAGARERLSGYYLLRSCELAGKGLPHEAAALLENITAPLETVVEEPQYEQILMLLLKTGRAGRALTFVEAAGKRLQKEGEKTNPLVELLADHIILEQKAANALPKEHPLLREAASILEGMKKLESGDDGAMEAALRPVALRSPFRYWKLLLKGVALFHQRKDEDAAEHLLRIPRRSAASAPAFVFLGLMGRDGVEFRDDLIDVQALRASVSNAMEPGKGKARGKLHHALNAVEQGRVQEAFTHLDWLFSQKGMLSEELKRRAAQHVWGLLVEHGGLIPHDVAKRFGRLVGFMQDTAELPRANALIFESRGEPTAAAEYWHRLAEALQQEKPPWLDARHLEKAAALAYLRAATNVKDEATMYCAAYHSKAGIDAEDLGLIDDSLEAAARLFPEHRPIYAAAVEIYDTLAHRKSKLSKWRNRMKKAFPGDDEALMMSIGQDIETGSLVRAEKEIAALLARRELSSRLRISLTASMLDLSRKYAHAGRWKEARRVFTELLAMKHDDEETREFVRLKYGCMECAAGARERGLALIDEALRGIRPAERGLLAAVVEMKRFGVPQSAAAEYRKALAKRIESRDISPEASTVALHQQYMKAHDYPSPLEEIPYVMSMIRIIGGSPLPEADLAEIFDYLEHIDPPPHSLLEEYVKKARKAYPGDMRFLFLDFYHVACKGRPKVLSGTDMEKLEKWAEGLRQHGDAEFSGRIHHFLNLCRSHAQARAPAPFPHLDDGFPFGGGIPLPPMPRKRRGAVEELPSPDEVLEMLMDLAATLPDPASPGFESTARAFFSMLGVPIDGQFLAMLREVKEAEMAQRAEKAGAPRARRAAQPAPMSRGAAPAQASRTAPDIPRGRPDAPPHRPDAPRGRPPGRDRRESDYTQLELF